MNPKKVLKDAYEDRFSRYLIIGLILAGIFLFFNNSNEKNPVEKTDGLAVDFFFHPLCPHCQEQKPFNQELMDKYPAAKWAYHDVTNPEEAALFQEYARKRNIPLQNLGVPGTFIGEKSFIGFDARETTGKDIENALEGYIQGKTAEKVGSVVKEPGSVAGTEVALPFLGKINALDYSLPFLAVILGLVDGFNPCAMWVLVYLISLIMALRDKRKIWLLVGSFVLASGMLYFLFMTAWLNAFLFLGYIRWLTIIIGIWAIYAGSMSLKDYFTAKNALVCEVTDETGKEKTMSRIERIVHSPLTWATILGIIGLAFIVNSVEFVCSSAIPAIFTQVLTLSNLSGWQYYGYILLYDAFFMLDDLIIFSLAAFAVSTKFGERYAKYCKLIGGAVLLVLGLMLAFAPQVLG